MSGKCDILNTDQGSQFTCDDFTKVLLTLEINISMDGKERALDNIFVERLWRSVKYEIVFPSQWETVQDAHVGLHAHFKFYNHERLHQSLNYKTPWSVYHG